MAGRRRESDDEAAMTISPNPTCVARTAFVLAELAPAEQGKGLALILGVIGEYGKREGWSAEETFAFVRAFGDATNQALAELAGRRRLAAQAD
jgi:hypothetical protein